MAEINIHLLKELDEKYGSPFYIMDVGKYKSNIRDFLAAFKKRYGKVIAGYSFKTNYVPALCQAALNEGCFAEVVSGMEYDLARKLGFEHIIFNGPIKRPHILEDALDYGVIINLDSEYEVDLVCKYKANHPENNVKVGLRVNVNLTAEEVNGAIPGGLRVGRFGFPSDILGRSIEKLRNAGIKIISIHGHSSSADRAVSNYRIIVRQMLAVCEKYNLRDLELFDIGGGFFGAAPEGMDLTGRPGYEDYAGCVLDEVFGNAWFMSQEPSIVIEPGSSVVSNVFDYYTKVYQKKRVGKVNFVIVDGTVFDVKPTMHNVNLPHKAYCQQERSETFSCDVVGSTCMEKDILLKEVTLPYVEAGDFIEFRGVGAYTVSLTPMFINYLEPILLEKENGFVEIRRRQTIDDVLTIYSW